MARGGSRPTGTRTSPPPISTMIGLYAFGRQPEAIHWDVAQLAGCLALIAEAPPLAGAARQLAGAVRGGAGRARCSRGSASRREATTRTATLASALLDGAAVARGRRSTASSSTGAAAAIPASEAYPSEPFRALAAALRGPRSAARPTPIGPTRRPARCYRRGRGDLGGDRRARRLGAVRGQDRRDPADGRGHDVDARQRLDRRGAAWWSARGACRTTRSISTEPATGAEIWSGHVGDAAAEVAAARAAWPDWAAHSVTYRIETLRRFANVVRAREEEFADLIARETGKPFWEARTEVDAVVNKVEISINAYSERTPQRRLEAAMGNKVAVAPQAARRAGGARPL